MTFYRIVSLHALSFCQLFPPISIILPKIDCSLDRYIRIFGFIYSIPFNWIRVPKSMDLQVTVTSSVQEQRSYQFINYWQVSFWINAFEDQLLYFKRGRYIRRRISKMKAMVWYGMVWYGHRKALDLSCPSLSLPQQDTGSGMRI